MSTIREELDKLLDFYDQHQPAMKGREVRVYLAPTTVEKFCTKTDGAEWYRGYKIKALNKPKHER
jgi:hypothetical protein